MLTEEGRRNKTILIDVWPPPEDHPFRANWLNLTVKTILESGVAEENLVGAII